MCVTPHWYHFFVLPDQAHLLRLVQSSPLPLQFLWAVFPRERFRGEQDTRTLRCFQDRYDFADGCRGKKWQVEGQGDGGIVGSFHRFGSCHESVDKRRVDILAVGCRPVLYGHEHLHDVHNMTMVEVGS